MDPLQPPRAGAGRAVLASAATVAARRGVSGILEEVDAWDGGNSNATLGRHRTADDVLKAVGTIDPPQQPPPQCIGQTFPTIPYYGILRGLCVEVPLLRASSSAASGGPLGCRDGGGGPLHTVAAKIRALPSMLDTWSRSGGGQLYRFGTSLCDATPVSAPQVLHMVPASGVGDAGLGKVPAKPQMGTAPQHRGRSMTGHVWYGEYVEALTDGMLQFFRLAAERPQPSGHSSGAAVPPPPVVLYVELHRHSRWRDIAVQFFVENGVACCFIASQHRPTQRHLSFKCAELDVELQWVHGAALVSSAPMTICETTTATDATTSKDTKPTTRRRSPPDGCRVLADILLNLNLMAGQPAGDTGVADSALLGSVHASIAASYPFLHGAWASHRLRPQGVLMSSNGGGGGAERSEGGAVAAQCFMSVVAQDAKVGAGAAAHPSLILPLESCFSKSVPVLGTSIASLLSVLIHDAQLLHFRLRFASYPSAKSRQRDGHVVTRRHTTVAPAIDGASAALVRTSNGITSVNHQHGVGGPGLDIAANASSCEMLSNGLCFSRLSSAFWLSETEKIALSASVEGIEDPLDGNDDGDGAGPTSHEDLEAEFYPLVIEYRRSDLATQQRTPSDPYGWGPFFFIKNFAVATFDG